jgi:hypothetical protein
MREVGMDGIDCACWSCPEPETLSLGLPLLAATAPSVLDIGYTRDVGDALLDALDPVIPILHEGVNV